MIQNSKTHLFDGSSITKGKQIQLSDFHEVLIDWIFFPYTVYHVKVLLVASQLANGKKLKSTETHIQNLTVLHGNWWHWFAMPRSEDSMMVSLTRTKNLFQFLKFGRLTVLCFFLQHVFVAFVSGTFVHWLWGCMRRVCWASKCLPESQWKEKLHAD